MPRRPKNTTRSATVEIRFLGDGRVVELPGGGLFGGVDDPKLGPSFAFNVWREVPDEDGALIPALDEGTYEGALQLNLSGTGDDFAELARFFLGLAALDTVNDPGFHQHFDNVLSVDGRTRVNIIVRRVQGGPSGVVLCSR